MEKIKKWWNKFSFKKIIIDYGKKISNFYTFTEGGKVRINFEKLFISTSFLMSPLLIFYFFASGENTAYIGRSPHSLTSTNNQPLPKPQQKNSNSSSYGFPVQQHANVVSDTRLNNVSYSHSQYQNNMKFAAKQVLIREDNSLGYGFPVGSNFIGELQSTIDTRDANQVVRVVLPYGGKSRNGGSTELPKGTLLLGRVNYTGKGEKVFIQFNQAIFPEGKTIKIAAIALDPKDYSTGLSGEIQSQAKSRTLSTLGLNALSAIGNVMIEKESLGLYQVEAKASAKNALLAGASKAAEIEAGRLQEQTAVEDFVQVDTGTAVVISLTQEL